MKSPAFVLAAFVIVQAFGGTARADDYTDCNQAADLSRTLRGCSNIIAAGRETRKNNLAIVYNNRGSAYIYRGDLDRAIADLDKAIRLNPQLALAYGNRGLAHNRKGDFDGAITDEAKAITLSPRFADAYVGRGLAHIGKGDNDPGIEDLTKAIELGVSRQLASAAYLERGLAFGEKSDYEAEIADETEAIRLKPDLGLAYYGRGNAFAGKGDLKRALTDYRTAAKLIPANDQWHGQVLARIAELEKEQIAAATTPAAPPAVPTAPASQVAATDLGRRVALVIGNDKYDHLASLQKAVADAGAYADVLRAKGFDHVILKTDLSRDAMDEAVAGFIDEIKPGDTAVFAYSGHGWSDGTQNYIVGTDAPLSGSQELIARVSLPLRNGINGIIDEMDHKGASLNVAIIDACRDNPFTPEPGVRDAGVSRGLVPIIAPRGTFVVFSAGAGQRALDRLSDADPDPDSVFARVFVPLIRADLTLQAAIKKTQEQVVALARTIRREQQPAYYDEVIGSACLSAACSP